MDPNEPIQPEIQRVCEAIIPDVKSWEEFISELTVPSHEPGKLHMLALVSLQHGEVLY